MFRDTSKSQMADNHVGAGSVICGGDKCSVKERFLIVCSGSKVALISNETFEVVSDWVEVQDPNFISGTEARKLCEKIGNMLGWTFTDFFSSSKGMKSVVFNNSKAE